jgi:hypothetical protein
MFTVQAKSHLVQVARIISVNALMSRGEMKSPSAGVLLRLDDGSAHAYLIQPEERSPAENDFLILDEQLHGISFVVSASKFALLFEAAPADEK